MKIVIVGTGAMGSVYAALLADAGNQVYALDIWREHIDAINQQGLRLEGASGTRLVRGIIAGSTVAELSDAGLAAPDLIIIATKASGVAAAASAIKPLLSPSTLVLTIQNGLGSGERIAQHLPTDNVLLGVAQGFGASMKGPAHAHHNSMSMIRIGSMSTADDPRVEQTAEVWRNAGFNTNAYNDIHQLIYEKFICNVAFSAPCTVYQRTIGEMMADPHAWQICQTCAAEAYRAALAKEINLSFEDPLEYVYEFGQKMPDARPSMLLDHLAHRPSEIDAINGMVPVVSNELGLSAPYNEVVSAIVRSRELPWHKVDGA